MFRFLLTLLLVPALAAADARTVKLKGPNGYTLPGEIHTFKVPENRNRQDSPQLTLSFLWLRTDNPNPKPPVIYLSDGSGSSGIKSIRGGLIDLVLPLLEERDVIALDRRGTGMSGDLPMCPEDKGMAYDRAYSREEWEARAREVARACAEWWQDRGIDMTAWNTEENADDVDALRQYIGADRIAIWGGSYGGHLAFSVLRRHGEHVERLLLNGIEGPDHTLKLPADSQALLEELDRKTAGLPVLQGNRLLDIMTTVLQSLEENPHTTTITDDNGFEQTLVIGAYDIQLLTAKALYGPKSMTDIPRGYMQMLNGDFSRVASRVARLRNKRLISTTAALTDIASGVSKERLAAVMRQRDETLLGDAANRCLHIAMDELAELDLGDDFRAPLVSSVPVLMVNGAMDGRTPPGNAEEVGETLRNAVLVTVEDKGHGRRILGQPGVIQKVLAFMRGEQVKSTRVYPSSKKTEWAATPLTQTQLKAYAGTYSLSEGDAVITPGDGYLRVRYKGIEGRLYPQGKNLFLNRERRIIAEFQLNADGKITGIHVFSDGRETIAEKVTR
ncbi:MAG: alpha/beta fold hydrolase [Acidobacteriota bacterium]|nr:alpha/beta fold hydrolase [Acidobacteriota bacterium]